MISRRQLLAAPALAGLQRPVLIDTHIHLFDPERFPYHPNAVYRPPAQTLDSYVAFVRQARIEHAVIVHPEPYQDDHSYLEFCFRNEPLPGFFKGTCLFDPVAAETPARMQALVRKLSGRIVAIRIHVNRKPGERPTTSGAIRDRDLAAPGVRAVWKKAGELGIAVQMHITPYHARQVYELAAEFPNVNVVIDHLGRPKDSPASGYTEVLKLARLRRVFMKYSSASPDLKDVVKRVFDVFGPERILWGGLGMTAADFEKRRALFEQMFDFAGDRDRARIRGLNALALYSF